MEEILTEKLKKSSKQIFKRDYKFAGIAEEMSHKSQMLMRHGCVAVRNGRIIAKGYNHYRTRVRGFSCGCSCHAEIDVLRKCFKEGNGNTRERDKVIYNAGWM